MRLRTHIWFSYVIISLIGAGLGISLRKKGVVSRDVVPVVINVAHCGWDIGKYFL